MKSKEKFEKTILGEAKKYYYGKIGLEHEPDKTFTKESDITQIKRMQNLLFLQLRDDIIPMGSHSKIPEKCLINGQDRRETMPSDKLSTLPYSAVVNLEMTFNLQIFSGSGVLVGPSHILTARHNTYEGGSANLIRAIPAQHGSQARFGEAICVEIFRFPDCDLALLVLDKPIGNTTGWLGVASYSDLEMLKNKQLEVTGYPGELDKRNRMYTSRGEIIHIIGDYVHYDIDTTKGQSGSPGLIKDMKQNLVVSIHTDHDETRNLNVGVLLTKQRLEIIKGWIEKTFWVRESPKGMIATIQGWLKRKLYGQPYEILNVGLLKYNKYH